MGSLDGVNGWCAPQAAVAVVGGHGHGVLAAVGDRSRPSRWASITKLASALATLVAIEEGTVKLDEPAGPPGATVRHLLAHASGLAFDHDAIVAGPGRRRIYSNTGFEVLADHVATRTAMPFDRYLAEAVLDPLAMGHTRLVGSAAAGLVGPLDDLVRLAEQLMAPTLVSSDTFTLATATAFPGLAGVLPGFGRQAPLDWGLGFDLKHHKSPHWTGARNSPAAFGHFGGSGSFLWVDPEADLACVALSRREFGPWARTAWPALSDAVVDEFGRHRSGPPGSPAR